MQSSLHRYRLGVYIETAVNNAKQSPQVQIGGLYRDGREQCKTLTTGTDWGLYRDGRETMQSSLHRYRLGVYIETAVNNAKAVSTGTDWGSI